VPELARLLAQRAHQMRMGMAQRRHRDAAAEIEISGAILGEDIGSFAPDERDVRPLIGWQYGRKHGILSFSKWTGLPGEAGKTGFISRARQWVKQRSGIRKYRDIAEMVMAPGRFKNKA
jgi:hypothetical protein